MRRSPATPFPWMRRPFLWLLVAVDLVLHRLTGGTLKYIEGTDATGQPIAPYWLWASAADLRAFAKTPAAES